MFIIINFNLLLQFSRNCVSLELYIYLNSIYNRHKLCYIIESHKPISGIVCICLKHSSLQVNDITYTANCDKANVLNDRLVSVLTRENTSFVPGI